MVRRRYAGVKARDLCPPQNRFSIRMCLVFIRFVRLTERHLIVHHHCQDRLVGRKARCVRSGPRGNGICLHNRFAHLTDSSLTVRSLLHQRMFQRAETTAPPKMLSSSTVARYVLFSHLQNIAGSILSTLVGNSKG